MTPQISVEIWLKIFTLVSFVEGWTDQTSTACEEN